MQIFDYEDIQLIPRKCVVNSRSEIDTTMSLGPHTFELPVVPANMASIMDEELAIKFAQNNYFYIMHRFNPETRLNFLKMMNDRDLISSISVGIKPEEYDFIDQLSQKKLVPDYITVDVAHGHSDNVMKMIRYIKKNLPDTFVIAGNICTPEAVIDLENAGADATKVGIGPGKACITKIKTGFGSGGWQLAAIASCVEVANKPIIADGGIRTHGDIAKSIRFGADFVMIGSLFAGHLQSPGEIVTRDDQEYKIYFGSASAKQKGTFENIEGKEMLIPLKGDIFDTLYSMKQDLQSSISYAGGTDLSSLRDVDYVVVKNSIYNGDNK